ncbi:MAG: hypothetical protein ACRDT4_03850 [Micromonosporaceae bacterium]
MSQLVKRGDSPQDRFAAEVLDLFRSDGRVEDAWYDRDQFAISVRPVDGTPVWARLTDLYEQWGLADSASRSAPLAQLVQQTLAPPELPDSWEAARELVRPVLRGLTAALPPSREPESGALWRRSMPYLAELVELDLPGGPALPIAHVEQWGISAEDVFATARHNLAARVLQPELSGQAADRVLRLVDDGGLYCVSQLLIDGWLAGFSWHLGGRPVAFLPDRSTLLVAPDNPAVLTSVFEMVEEEYDRATRPVSPMAYTVDGTGRLVPYAAPHGHPLYVPAGRAERVLAAAEYGKQKRWLEDAGSPHRAGTVMLSGRSDGSVFSVATMSRDGATLLPRTDYVAMYVDAAETVFVAWDDAQQILGLKPEQFLEPERYLVDPWLAGGSRGALHEAAVDPCAGNPYAVA